MFEEGQDLKARFRPIGAGAKFRRNTLGLPVGDAPASVGSQPAAIAECHSPRRVFGAANAGKMERWLKPVLLRLFHSGLSEKA